MSSMSPADRERPAPPRSIPGEQGPAAAWMAYLRPLLWQTWLNLKVWTPFLLNPIDRARQVVYHAREHREGFTWHIRLPVQCWRCGQQQGLWQREIEVNVRGFEHALSIVGAAGGCALFFWLLAVWSRSLWMFVFGLASVVAGWGLLYVKSWIETVDLHMYTCPDHAGELRLPGLVVHENELHLFLPTDSLSQATRFELRAERLGRDRGLPGVPRGTESDVEPPPARERYQSPRGPAPPRPVELPPIKLAGEDEE
jgi:hypothetical protein